MNNARKVMAGDKPRGAGWGGFVPAVQMGWTPDAATLGGIDWRNTLESAIPPGSIAYLLEPYALAPHGINKTVERFEKKPNGRWLSQPGGDFSFASVRQLAEHAVLARVEIPPGVPDPSPQPQPQPEPQPAVEDPEEPAQSAPAESSRSDAGNDPAGAVEPATKKFWYQTAAGVITLAAGSALGTGLIGLVTWALFRKPKRRKR